VFDVVRFSKSIGGLDAALTVLAELGEEIQAAAIRDAAKIEPVRGNVQRLGWLLDRAGYSECTSEMAAWSASLRPSRAVLNSSLENRGGSVCPKWRIIENDQPEGELRYRGLKFSNGDRCIPGKGTIRSSRIFCSHVR
jgi:hypothetical protein